MTAAVSGTLPHTSRSPWRLFVAAGGVVFVLVFGLAVARTTGWTAGELPVDRWISAHHVAALNAVAALIAVVFSPFWALLLLAALCVVAYFRRRDAWYGVSCFAVAGIDWLGCAVFKGIVHRPRPDAGLLANPPAVDPSFSYPSGHTVFATVFVLTCVVVLGREHRQWSVVSGIVVVMATAASRVYLGVHYPSDVVAGIVYAVCAFVLLSTLQRRVLTHRAALSTGQHGVDPDHVPYAYRPEPRRQ